MRKCKRVSCRDSSSRRSYENFKTTGKKGLTDFTASNGWLEKWKQIYGVREKILCGESTTIVQARIERLPELRRDYEPRNIFNLDELQLFFKNYCSYQRKL